MADNSTLKNTMHHLSMKTSRTENEVIEFYTGSMGLPYVRKVEVGADLLLYFELAENLLLEVIITAAAEGQGGEAAEGFAHFAFTVAAIEPWLKKVQEAGLKITYGPAVLHELRINTFLFIDPFGAEWEIMEDTE